MRTSIVCYSCNIISVIRSTNNSTYTRTWHCVWWILLTTQDISWRMDYGTQRAYKFYWISFSSLSAESFLIQNWLICTNILFWSTESRLFWLTTERNLNFATTLIKREKLSSWLLQKCLLSSKKKQLGKISLMSIMNSALFQCFSWALKSRKIGKEKFKIKKSIFVMN